MTPHIQVGSFDLRHGSMARSGGLHLTDILREIGLKIGVFKAEDLEQDIDTLIVAQKASEGGCDHLVRVAVGLAWEDWISRQIPGLSYHPGEIVLDGIAMTPDGIVWTKNSTVVHEFKATWKSMRKPIAEQWLWWSQLKGYCQGVGTRHGVLDVLWVNGDYRGSGPQYMAYQVEFSGEELEANWKMVTRYAAKLDADWLVGAEGRKENDG